MDGSPLHLEWQTLDQTKMEMRQESIGLKMKGGYEVVRGETEERALKKKDSMKDNVAMVSNIHECKQECGRNLKCG